MDGKFGYTLLSGINLAIIDLFRVSYWMILGFHQSVSSSCDFVVLNQLSLKPSKVTALFLDIYYYMRFTFWIVIGCRKGYESGNGHCC